MMKGVGAAVAIAMMVTVPTADAMVFGGSNLPLLGYPDPQCQRPFGKPVQPFQFSNQYELDAYNEEVRRYNDRLDRYIRCAREYLENANNDIARIKEKMDDLIAETRRL